MSLFTEEQQWKMMDSYFRSHTYAFTKHHIDSYREFLRDYIPSTIRTFNPITMLKLDPKGDPILSVRMFVGGSNGDAIYIDRPTMIDANNTEVLLTPAEARQRNLTYEGHLYADVHVQYELTEGNRSYTSDFQKVLLGAIPLMVHSDACILNGQGPEVLRELGECIYDSGGYFIIDGKEKVIVSQERVANNKLFVKKLEDDTNFAYRAYIKCVGQVGESKLAPRNFELYMAHDIGEKAKTEDDGDIEERSKEFLENAVYISFSGLKSKVPLFLLFRALGLESDEQIIKTIFGTADIPMEYVKYMRASAIASHRIECFTQEKAIDILQYRVKYQLVEYVKNLMVTDIFPNVEDPRNKPIYLGFLVRQFLDTCLGIVPPTDHDAYTIKRVDISGFQLAELFQKIYMLLRKNCRDLLDREYNLGPWRNNGNARITTLVRKDNIYKLFPPAILTDGFMRSLKGMWGSTDGDAEQGKVQDVSRISYLGYLSHMRRINHPMDRALKVVSPHRLHAQQWGMFCPFETPDGTSLGLLKNFALLASITFGTGLEKFQENLPRLGVIPLAQTTGYGITGRDVCKVFLNGTWYGISRDPVYHARLLKALRRNGYINPFVSISWSITENVLHIQTDPGRVCRPLLIVQGGRVRVPRTNDPARQLNWFAYLFGEGWSALGAEHSSLKDAYYTEEMYYKDLFMLPKNWSDPDTPEERMQAIQGLEETQGCIEYVDVAEEDTCMIAMSPKDIVDKPGIEYTHCEIHPCAAFSVVTNTVPFANHNYAARNLFHGAQAKQTVGMYATNFRRRFDTAAYIMHYPQKPMITTKPAQYTASTKMPNGFNAIVAIATNTGFNQEDGVIINRSAIDRGLFHSTAYKTMTASEKVISPYERLQFINPYTPIDILAAHGIPEDAIDTLKGAGYTTLEDIHRVNEKRFAVEGLSEEVGKMVLQKTKEIKEVRKDPQIQGLKDSTYYQLLDENGIIREGAKVPRGTRMVGIGMAHVREEHREVSRGILSEIEKIKHYRDISHMTDVHYYGIVDKVFFGTKALGSSDRICKVRFRKNRRPEVGDKFCSMHGQKGVIGMVLPEADMPTTKDGIIPDLIINPHALPSRMTIAHLVECIFSKACCFDGSQGDATMFIPVDYNAIGKSLEAQGYEKHGNEIMYDGRTGRQIQTEIFIGPTFYYRLKHMVSDKVHARGGNPRGLPRPDLPYDQLTRQPTEGRAKSGGLRVGEMERDVIVSHGMSQFSKESVMDRSDRYSYAVCRHCGVISSPVEHGSGASVCLNCKRSNVSIVETPYAWKLFLQEFEAFGVQIRMVTDPIMEEQESDTESESEVIEEAELEALLLPDDDLYEHNQDLDETELVGGSTEIIDLEEAPPVEAQQAESPVAQAQPAEATPAEPPTAQVPPAEAPAKPPAEVPPAEAALVSSKPEVLTEPVPTPEPLPNLPLQSGGANMILDLDGGDLEPMAMLPATRPSTPIAGGNSEIKVIEISGGIAPTHYKPPKEHNPDEMAGGEMDDDFFS